MKRALVLIATFTLAGAAVGCDSNRSSLDGQPGFESSENIEQQDNMGQAEVDDQFGGLAQQEGQGVDSPQAVPVDPGQPVTPDPGQPATAEAEQPGAMPEQPIADPTEMAEADSPDPQPEAADNAEAQDEMASNTESADEPEDSRIKQTRESVSSSLGIPASAVIVAAEDREKIMSAEEEFEREARVTASTVEKYLDQVDSSSLDDSQKEAYQELQTSITTLDTDLDQFAMSEAEQRDDMKSQIEEHLSSIDKNWKSILDRVDFSDSAIGGGPEEGQDDSSDLPEFDDSAEQPMEDNKTY
ncbi:hypothetical protein DN745_10905 [Bradymonas sediminis]|uniref:Uncharacterized protein n=2 Tax=Bradymonas sediminis TaxID=1548548 RepID=A0A2Z4FLW0_9DELT|nr:hypothetical protein DN745_10905 [Bradymonas sediminis]